MSSDSPASAETDQVFQAVADVLYITPEDLTEGEATDLTELGLDSLRLVLILERLAVSNRPEASARIAAAPTLATLRELAAEAKARA